MSPRRLERTAMITAASEFVLGLLALGKENRRG